VLIVKGNEITSCSIGLTNVADTPLWAEEAARVVIGSTLDAPTVRRAVMAAEAITSPASDRRGTAHYRTKMAGVMLGRALAQAKQRARA
jgi:carbon-monoxide dehydrogenase medium subunit